jgi:hypothetical protein
VGKRRFIARVGGLVAAVGLIFGLGVGAAQASVTGVHLQHATDSYCLDSNSIGDVYFNPCQHGNTYQEWNITSTSTGYHVQDVGTGRCLDILFGSGQVPYIATGSCGQPSAYISWKLVSGSYGYEFDDTALGYCLDGNRNANPSIYPTTGVCIPGNGYQNWYYDWP